jgi:hypothetical protein
MIRVADRISAAVESVYLNRLNSQPGTHRHGSIGVVLDPRRNVTAME